MPSRDKIILERKKIRIGWNAERSERKRIKEGETLYDHHDAFYKIFSMRLHDDHYYAMFGAVRVRTVLHRVWPWYITFIYVNIIYASRVYKLCIKMRYNAMGAQ